MTVSESALHALIQGLTSVLPLSESAHQLAVEVLLDGGTSQAAARVAGAAGCVVALSLALRHRLGRAFTEGIRGIARPGVLHTTEGGRDAVALAIAATLSTLCHIGLAPYTSELNRTPLVAGAGLLLTTAALLSTLLAPTPRQVAPGPLGAALVGLAHGLALVPGASSVAAAFVVLRWLRVSHWRAAELSLLVSLPVVALTTARAALTPGLWRHAATGALALAVVSAAVGASLAVSWWRGLCDRRRTPALGAWMATLAIALLAYGRALPEPATSLPAPRIDGT